MKAVLLVLFAGFAATARVQDRTVYLTAEVAMVEDPGGVLSGAIQPGDIIVGTYTYNVATPDSNPLATVGDYWHIGTGSYGISLQAGDLVFRSNPDNVMFLVELVNDHGTPASDNYLLRSYNNLPASCGVLVEHIAWQLDDPGLHALSDTRLPVDPPVLRDWQSLFGLTIEGPTFSWLIRAHVTSVTSTPRTGFMGAPVPSSCQALADSRGLEHRYRAGTCARGIDGAATKR